MTSMINYRDTYVCGTYVCMDSYIRMFVCFIVNELFGIYRLGYARDNSYKYSVYIPANIIVITLILRYNKLV